MMNVMFIAATVGITDLIGSVTRPVWGIAV
jgi:hypothetical protein